MNIETLREYCLAHPLVTEDCAFGPDTLLFRIYGKIFVCIDLNRPDRVVVKCDPEQVIRLRDERNGVLPAWHWNKRYWNELLFDTDLDDEEIKALVDHSLSEVLKKMPRRLRDEYATLTEEER